MEHAYARCVCGWECPAEDMPSPQAAAAHVPECEYEMRALLVPMWSVEHPWYWSDASVAYRAGTGPQPPYGIGVYWKPAGSHSVGSPFGHGGAAKTYHLFPTVEGAVT